MTNISSTVIVCALFAADVCSFMVRFILPPQPPGQEVLGIQSPNPTGQWPQAMLVTAHQLD